MTIVSHFELTPKQAEAAKIMKNHLYTLLVGGSRSGKTFFKVRTIVQRALRARSRHLIARLRFNHVKTSIWYDTLPKVMATCFPHVQYEQNKSDWFIRLPNDSEIWIAGIDNKERTEKILGKEYSTILVNECSQIDYENGFSILSTRLAEKSGLVNRFLLDCNPPTKKHWTYKLFIELKDPITDEPKDSALFGHLFMNPTDNLANLPESYISQVLQSLPKRQRERFLLGNYVNDIDGAIWSVDLINKCISEFKTFDDLKKMIGVRSIVIGVDPSTKNKADSDLCGIVVVCQGNDNKFYVLEDLSLKASPGEWAEKVIYAYRKYNANKIIVETNQGGEMVAEILRLKNFFGKIEEVHASHSKHARAEPVEAMYEQGKVEHLDSENLRHLEDEMTSYIPLDSKKSPDRLDALVWAMSYYLTTKDIVSQYQQIDFGKLTNLARR